MCKMVKVYVYSHIGNSRRNQEDNYFIGRGKYLSPADRDKMSKERKCKIDSSSDDQICCCISDGMGGHSSGEVASLLTVCYFNQNYEELIEGKGKTAQCIKEFITKLNKHVCFETTKDTKLADMGATLCGLISNDEKYYCFNVGDSRMYQYSAGILKQVTVDNTEGQRLLNLGLLTQEEVKTFPKKKAIYKYIGKDIELIPDVYEIGKVEEGTMFLLCSDGLSDVLDLNEIQDMLSKQYIKTEDKGKFLVEMAVEKKPDAGDNITLIIIEC